MTQHNSSVQSVKGCKMGKDMGMNREGIPTSLPGSTSKMGTAVPTSRSELASRRYSKASGIVSLILLLAYLTLGVIVYRDYQKSERELDEAHARFCESMDQLREEMERHQKQRAMRLKNSLPPTPNDNVKH